MVKPMTLEVTFCDGKAFQPVLNKEKIVFDMTRGPLKDKLKPDKEQIDLAKEISKLCWRILKGPADFFWDDDAGEVLGWYEKENGSKPKMPVNFWPLWTIEDAVSWIKDAGYSIFKIYISRDTNAAEVYFFQWEGSCIVYSSGVNLLVVLLKFILNKLKGGAECGQVGNA